MKELLKNLTNTEIKFIFLFANTRMTQIPYINENTISELNVEYLTKRLRRQITELDTIDQLIAESILKKYDYIFEKINLVDSN